MSPEEVLNQLAIQRCDGLTDAHRKEIENAGYDIETIAGEGGISAERLPDAAFFNQSSELAPMLRATAGNRQECSVYYDVRRRHPDTMRDSE